MKAINIKGNSYVPVHERLKEFYNRDDYKGWYINTEILEVSDKHVLIKASIYDKDGTVRATGHGYERAVGLVNETSHIENCETSCIGRALGILGIGIDASLATLDEVEGAKRQKAAPLLAKTCISCGKTFKTKLSYADKCKDCYFNNKTNPISND